MTRSTEKRHLEEIYELKRLIKEKDSEIQRLQRIIANNEKVEVPIKNNTKDVTQKAEKTQGSLRLCPSCSNILSYIDIGINRKIFCPKCCYRTVEKLNV